MPLKIDVSTKDGTSSIEAKLLQLDALPDPEDHSFIARISSDRRATFFKDIWAAITVSYGLKKQKHNKVVAWGIKEWPSVLDEDGFELSHPGIVANHHRIPVVTDSKPQIEQSHDVIRFYLIQLGGELGSGARQRTVIELDPYFPVASELSSGMSGRDAFFAMLRRNFKLLEIGARASKEPDRESPSKSTLLEFLYEIHCNAYEYARKSNSVRFLRLQKHQFPNRSGAMKRASDLPDLKSYLNTQSFKPSSGVFNIVEASVSDFGPGIIDGFLSSFAGRCYHDIDRRTLLSRILHEQLSSKGSNPNSGLGISQALSAARELDAFVSLRTDEFWLTMRGRADTAPELTFRQGTFSKVVGTHWQLLLPDITEPLNSGVNNV